MYVVKYYYKLILTIEIKCKIIKKNLQSQTL